MEIPAEHIIVSVGYESDRTLYEKIKGEHTYLIGDAETPANVMAAVWKAYETAMNI
jgi:2-enoate reductase